MDTALVTVRYRDSSGRLRLFRFVMKQLADRSAREAIIYERLVSAYAADIAPRVLAIHRPSPNFAVLYLEPIRRASAWPWRDLSNTRELLRRLAEFHIAAVNAMELVGDWDYEVEHCDLAWATRTALDRYRYHPDLPALSKVLPAVSRLVVDREKLRRQLLAEKPLQAQRIHGDVHPGNALVRSGSSANKLILLDWARARVGSPLEDVSSWLHSLGFWESEAKRRHDTLLGDYLAACGMDHQLTPHRRAAYWLAGASNALSGALLHHLRIAEDATQSTARRLISVRAAQGWLRVIRRADAWWS